MSSVSSSGFQDKVPIDVGTEVGVTSRVRAFTSAKSPLSLSVTTPFWMSFPVVESKRASALSVEDAGHTTSPVHPPAGRLASGTFPVPSSGAYPFGTPFCVTDCFIASAFNAAVESGLSKSEVLSTFHNPICDFVTP